MSTPDERVQYSTPQAYALSPTVVELLDRAAAAGLRGRRPGSLFDSFDRDELLGLAAVLLAEVARRDKRCGGAS